MRVAFVTNSVSPHQLPLACELAARMGAKNLRYIAVEPPQEDRRRLGWRTESDVEWVLQKGRSACEDDEISRWITKADVLLSGIRLLDTFEERAQKGLKNCYMSERWLKPGLGIFRLCSPKYLAMARRFVRLSQQGALTYLPIGVHAARDMSRLGSLLRKSARFHGSRITDPHCRGPANKHGHPRIQCVPINRYTDKMRLWGYFVAPSEQGDADSGLQHSSSHGHSAVVSEGAGGETSDSGNRTDSFSLHILWVGRMLSWKRVDSLICAVDHLTHSQEKIEIDLKIVGHGPQENVLKQMVVKRGLQGSISFLDTVPIAQVRTLMRQADVYVLPSNGYEGWGAVVNEAMLEGAVVVASDQSGAGATLIRDGDNGFLFRPGDIQALSQTLKRLAMDQRLRRRMAKAGRDSIVAEWTPAVAADRLFGLWDAMLGGREHPVWERGPLSFV